MWADLSFLSLIVTPQTNTPPLPHSVQLLAQKKRIIVLDEPFIGLDKATARGIATQLCQMRERTGTAFILISHQDEYAQLLKPVRVLQVCVQQRACCQVCNLCLTRCSHSPTPRPYDKKINPKPAVGAEHPSRPSQVRTTSKTQGARNQSRQR